MGKAKAILCENLDCGDYVVVIKMPKDVITTVIKKSKKDITDTRVTRADLDEKRWKN